MIAPNFSFAQTPQIIFGIGKIERLTNSISYFGNNVLLLTGSGSLKKSGLLDVIIERIKNKHIKIHLSTLKGEPSPEFIDDTLRGLKTETIDAVVAIGGGSVVDAGKAISAMFFKDDSVLNYLEGIGTKKHDGKKLPFIAVPTTSGTGSEATKNAVLSQIGTDGFKKSLRHSNFVPDIALIDPQLTVSCPKNITSACGMDAFTQLLESYVSDKASPFTDALAISGIKQIKDNLLDVCTTKANDLEARAALSYASLVSGITLANAGLGVVHGFASTIGGFFDTPHSVVCGTLVGAATESNLLALVKTNNNVAIRKYAHVGRLLTGNADLNEKNACSFLVDKIHQWTDILQIPKLGSYGMNHSDIELIIKKTSQKNNPVKLSNSELSNILSQRI